MESWTWADVLLYFLCTCFSILINLPAFAFLIFLVKFPYFLLISLPFEVLTEFKITSFERRKANRTYNSFFQISALSFNRWVLRTFQPEIIRALFFSELHARTLFAFRRFKYGTENIGDFDYTKVETKVGYPLYQPLLADNNTTFIDASTANGYWVRSKSREHLTPDLVVYFVPGGLVGCASAYMYLEFLSMFLVELQVQGFRNPAVYCLDVDYYVKTGKGFDRYALEVQKGWFIASKTFPRAKTMFMGSGVGATAQLSLLLHIARPTAGIIPLATKTILPLEASETNDIVSPIASAPSTDVSAHVLSEPIQQGTTNSLTGLDNLFSTFHPSNFSNLDDCISEPNCSITDENHQSQISILATETSQLDNNYINEPEFDIPNLKRPDAVVLISPLGQLGPKCKSHYPDFISQEALGHLTTIINNESNYQPPSCKPGQVISPDWWNEAIPNRGIAVFYGGNETQKDETEQLIKVLKNVPNPRVFVDYRPDEVHSWPITNAYTGRTVTEQMDGVIQVCGGVAKMLVMDCIYANSSMV